MKHPRLTALIVAAFLLPTTLAAQQRRFEPQQSSSQQADQKTDVKPEHVTTQHSATIGGQKVDYDATVGDIILRDDDQNPTAAVYYTAYIRRGVSDVTHRPVVFAYNGGPGSSSIWVHMGAFGPKRVATPDTTHSGPPPYRLEDNQHSLLDVADLVFIDPVGTGFSHPLGKATGKDFWGVDQDARSLAQFVTRWLTENGRWNSPRYLIGESYGTTRSAVLGNILQRESVGLNGIVFVSTVLDFQTISFQAGNDEPYIMYLPGYAAVAWYHDALPNKPPELRPFLKEVEQFATTDYAQALLAGSNLDATTRSRILDKLVQYTGLNRDYLDKANLRVDAGDFEKELLREKGLVVGRLDARFTGPTGDLLAERAPYDPQSADISGAYVALFRDYLRNQLNFKNDRIYQVSGNVRPWDWQHGFNRGWPGFTNVAVDLAQMLTENPRMHVMVAAGLYDLATPYFAAEYTMDHLGLPADLQAHIRIDEYDAGHMMYVNPTSLVKLKTDIASFMADTSR